MPLFRFSPQPRSVTLPLGKCLVGVTHEPDQSNTAGKHQQTGGCNSGAVALPDGIDKQVAMIRTERSYMGG